MPKCINIRKKHRQVCVGDLEDFGTITRRAIQAPSGSSVDFTEEFTDVQDTFMLIETVRGESIFDEVSVEQDVTHHVYIPYIAGVTFQDWVDVEDQRYDIIDVEDLDNRHEFQLLRCTNRGLSTEPATEA